MNRKTLNLTALILLAALGINAQSSRAIVKTELSENLNSWQSEVLEVPLENAAPFIAFSMSWDGEEGTPQIRFSEDGTNWQNWEELSLEVHAEQRAGHWISELYYAKKESKYVQIKSSVNMGTIEAHFYNPGKTKPASGNEGGISRDPQYCPCPQPAYQGRLDWCPDGSCPEDATPQFTSATHLIIHHSAGTNTANDWAAIVRSIWDFHVFQNGWDDIGYNWLVDPNGVIYEGRGDGRLGAHFCGNNGATVGTCVLGDFTNITPTDEALEAVTELYAWKACDISVDPLGSSNHASSGIVLDNISGHRDGCSTQCPGNSFYPLLPQVRQDIVEYTALSCAPIGAPLDLVAVATSDTTIMLDWVDITDNEEGFSIERSTSFNGTYTEITTVTENIETYEDTGLTPQTGYYYRVRAFNAQDTSIYSNKAFAATVIVSTDDVSPAEIFDIFPNPTNGQLNVNWSETVEGWLMLNLTEITGRQLLSRKVPGYLKNETISIHHLPAGMYLMEITLPDGSRFVERIIKD